jgi:predicted nucleotidyltransferase
MTEHDKAETIEKLTKALARRPGIVFAWLFGSFVRLDIPDFRDLDVAVFFEPGQDCFASALALGSELSLALGVEVDCVPLNLAPTRLGFRAISEGRELVCRDRDRMEDFIEETVVRELDFRPIREQAIRDLAGG